LRIQCSSVFIEIGQGHGAAEQLRCGVPRAKHTAPGARDPINNVIAKFGYFDLGPQLAEHGPRIFSANGMEAKFHHPPGGSDIIQRSKLASPLVLQFTQGRISSQGPVVRTVSLLLVATLYDQRLGKQRVWTGQFRIHLGHDPALGVGKTTSVDQQFVEDLLVIVLEQMSKDQVVALKGSKVVRPSGLKQ
jgi:hypothetical protein